MEELIEYLKSFAPGEIPASEFLERLVWTCWDEFEGTDETRMDGHKLLYRMETPSWRPPIFSFTIERHGPTAGGSIWADEQRWTLNLETKKAEWEIIGRRRVRKPDAALKVGPIAREVANLIIKGKTDDRLKWNKDGSVRVRIGEIIPETKKETTGTRRKRLRKALTEAIAEFGWKEIRPNVYSKS